MASFTPNYNLDLYDSTDKPNLRDQYNGAMGKIDSMFLTQNGNINNAVTTANKALELSNQQGEAVDELQTDMTAAQGSITQLTQDSATHTEQITKLTTDLETETTNREQQDQSLLDNYNGLNTRVTALEGGAADNLTDIVFIGDSYGTGYQPTGGALSNNIPVLAAQYLGLTLHNFSNNASGYITVGDNSKDFADLVDDAYNDSVTNDYNGKVKFVVIMGGRNDSTTTTGFDSSCRAVLTDVKEKFPSAQVAAFYLWDAYRRPNDNQITNFRALMKACGSLGVLTDSTSLNWGLLEIFMYSGTNGTDIHPNGAGCEHLAGCIAQVLTGGNPDQSRVYTLDKDSVRYYKNGHHAIIQFNGLNLTGNADVVIAAGIPDCLRFSTLQPCITSQGNGMGWLRCDADGNGYSATLKFIGGKKFDNTNLDANAGVTFFTGVVDLLANM